MYLFNFQPTLLEGLKEKNVHKITSYANRHWTPQEIRYSSLISDHDPFYQTQLDLFSHVPGKTTTIIENTRAEKSAEVVPESFIKNSVTEHCSRKLEGRNDDFGLLHSM